MNRADDKRRSSATQAGAPRGLSKADVDCAQLVRLGAGVFAVLMSYYLLKPAREALLASSTVDLSGAELRGLATVAQGIFAGGLAAVYARLADRLDRRRLVATVNGLFAAGLFLVALGVPLDGILPAYTGDVVVYVATGAAGIVIVAQIWAFATDVEGRRAGRMLPILSLAASAGGAAGALLARFVVAHAAHPRPVLFIGAALGLCLAALLAAAADRNRIALATSPVAVPDSADTHGGTILPSQKYLLGTAMVTLVAQWVGTNGENLLFGYVQSHLNQQVLAGLASETGIARETMAFYASFSLWSNLAALAMQVAVVYGCVQGRSGRNLLLVLPLVTLASATVMIFVPALGLVKCLKVAENATRYSINNTAAQLLWLPTNAAMKYKAKIVIETVVVRLADGLAALTAFIGLRLLHAPLREMYVFNALLVVIWAIAAAALVREQDRRLQATAKVVSLPIRRPVTSAPPFQCDIAA